MKVQIALRPYRVYRCHTHQSAITGESDIGYTPNVTLEQCSNTYFSGYLGKKCVEKFKCRLCENVMLKETNDEQFNEKEFLIFCKNYDS